MKRVFFILPFILFLLAWGCDDEESVLTEETGTVIDFSGTANCSIAIGLDNGNMVQPKIFPEGFIFADGQRVRMSYVILKNVISGCEKGVPCEIHSIKQIGCTPYVNLTVFNYDSLKRDPVFIHEAYIDGDCLHIKLSYSGGCRTHTIDLARIFPECGTPPLPPPTFEIRHNANGDACEAFITRDFRFDLTPLKKEGSKEFVLNAGLTSGKYSKTFTYPLK